MNILKKIRNIIFWVILAICLIIPIVTHAQDLSLDGIKQKGAGAVGNTVVIQPGFNTGHNLYCINYPEHWPTNQRMNIQSYIEIMGNKATNAKGQTIDNIYNGVIAYGVNKSSGENPYKPCICGKHNHGFSTGQVILWDYMGAWYNQVGSKLGVHCTIVGTSGRCEPIGDPFGEAAKMNNVSLGTNVTNHTKTDDLKPTEFTLDNEKWIEMGPYKYEFSGNVTSIEVTDQNGQAVNQNNYKICGRNSSGNRTILSTVPSNQNFYVAVKMKKGYENINVKVNAKVEGTLYGARLWFLTTNAGQNLLLSQPKTETVSKDFNFNFGIDLKQDICIEKENVKYDDVKLKKVGFIVENITTGKYINEDDSGKITYVGKANATTFFTNDDGKIKIEKVLMGEYNFYEVYNEEPGYDPNPDKPYKVNNITKTAKYDILKNTPVRGNIHIEKVDKDIPEYKLGDVDFIIEQVDTDGKPGKGFVQSGGSTVGEKAVYGENETKGARETAKTFTTSSNEEDKGELTVYELEIGYTYYFWEVRNDHPGYGIPSEPYEVTLTQDNIDKSRTYYVGDPFKNERIFVDLAGYVWEDVQCGKANILNHIFNSTVSDSKDSKEAIGSNVTVKLMKKGENGAEPTVVATTQTTNGEYIFREVLIKELPNYYIQFEYDGLIYENVIPWKNLLTPEESQKAEVDKIKEAIINMAIEDKAIGKDGKTLSEEEKQELPETYPTDYLTQEDKDKWYEIAVTAKGSKAAETPATRDNFNASFVRVDEIEGINNQVSIKNGNGQQVAKAEYTLGDYEAKLNGLVENTLGNMTADTLNTGVEIYYDKTSVELLESGVLDGFNLGLYKRAQTDIALGQDLNDVQVSIKGKTAKYTKGAKNKQDDSGEFVDDVWNVGLTRFETETYDQPIYRADYMYNEGSEDQKLKMFFTYKIALKNQSSIKTEINEIVEYYDPNFDVTVDNGFEVYLGDSKGNKTENGDLTVVDTENTNTYSGKRRFKIIGNGKIQLNGYTTKYLYIKFPLTRERMAEVFNADKREEILSSSVAEITSYSTYKNDKSYATVDSDSVAGNVNLNDKKRYEDDTNDAADAKLYIAEERKVQGIVFEDKEDADKLKNENIRQGDGAYNDGETKVDNVKVELIENPGTETERVAQIIGLDKDWKENFENASTKTTDGGSYSFEGITPGTYVVRFTWGLNNGERKVTEYKATIVDKAEYENAVNNPYFYRNITAETQNRNRATDDTTIRAEIDKGLREHKEGEETKTGNNYATPLETLEARDMVSNSEKMTFEIEHKGVDIDLFDLVDDKKLQYVVNGMNLGIIRRPLQNITISKRVTNVTVKYSSGEGIIDADIDEQGKISGQDDNIAYIGTSTNRRQAQVKIELDNEVLGNSGTEVTYEYVVTNDSEKDYTSVDFQRFGTNADPDKLGEIVTLTPAKIMDYIGKESTYKVCDENTNNGWKIVTSDTVGEMVDGDVRNSEATKESKMYMTEKINNAMEPKATEKLNMVVEKRLTSAEDSNMTNQVEIIQVNKPNAYNSGSPIMTKDFNTIKLGNYVPEGINAKSEIDDSMAETVIIVPSTGGDRNYIPEIAIGLTALITLAGGVYFIRRIVTKKE